MGFGTILRIKDKAFKVEFLTSVSDFGPDDLFGFLAHDDLILDKLITLTTQIPYNLKLPDYMKVKSVCLAVLKDRSEVVGLDMKNVKKQGANIRNEYNFVSFGAYTPKFGPDEKLIEIMHRPTGHVVKTPDSWINRNCTMVNNHDDMAAYFKRPNFPDYYLHKFYEGTLHGPYDSPRFVGSKPSVQLEKYASTVHNTWLAEAQAVSAGASATTEVEEKACTLAKAEAGERVAKARVAAKVRAARRSEQCVVVLKA